MRINRIGPLSCAKIAGLVYAVLGLVLGALVSAFALLGLAFSATQRDTAANPVSALVGVALGIGAIICFPIIYGLTGFLTSLIGAWLYNVIASKIGGIEVDITDFRGRLNAAATPPQGILE